MLKPLGGHAVFLLLVQLSLLLVIARLGSEAAKRLGLPAVVGELAAGIALGPSGLGHFAPGLFAALFPHDSAQFHLLEVVGTLGMVLLLLLTGLETDLRLLKNLGRAALIASGMGMAVPFVTGLALGAFMPDQYLAKADQRTLFCFFLATAMAISAMPVIAKILMDLNLTRRNIGLVILSAGVVDDTAGWLILSVIAGVASHGELRLGGLLTTLLFTAAFIGVAAAVVYPGARWLTSFSRRFRTKDTDLVLLLVVTFLCAAATEWIGIHAVFGAFVAGTLFRQVPQLEPHTVHRLESFVFSVLAPVFFGIVGLKVNLWELGGGTMLAIVLGVACFGKLVGCTVGSLWGGLRFWEGLSIAVAMNARGAMELVVATIGLSLGILNQQMFSIIVVVAVVTSFMAPLGLRLTMRKVRMTDEENRRILAEETKGVFDPARIRILLPTSGGPNLVASGRLAAALAKRSAHPVDVVHVKPARTWRDRLRDWLDGRRRANAGEAQLSMQRQLIDAGLPPTIREIGVGEVSHAVLEEARKGFDLIVVGASQPNALGGAVLEDVVRGAPCHVAIVKGGPPDGRYGRLLVPFDGTTFARVAVELAVRYAEAAGAELTIAVDKSANGEAKAHDGAEIDRISPVFRTTTLRPQLVSYQDDASGSLQDLVGKGQYELVVIGAENRAIQNRLFFGYENERLINGSPVAVAIVVPNVAALR